ncbi:DUF5067 domain-containing protein [Bacillus sp. JJ1764]|uniref:DUF5067 domain-containing protein n=1 Tax=Bacillus sp. JJ1764 TaxID=3122964 RepID=UPI002FFE0318
MIIRKKLTLGIMLAGILIGILAGCGAEKPTDVVNGYLTSIQKGDFKKAGSYVNGGKDSLKTKGDSTADDKFTTSVIEAISKNYKYEKPVEVSVSGDKAVVKVKISSVDFGEAMTATMAEVMPLAFASAFEEKTPKSEKAFEKLMEKTALKHLKAEDVSMATRTVKFNLEKNKDGVFKIVNNDSLTESIYANFSQLKDMFGENENEVKKSDSANNEEKATSNKDVYFKDNEARLNDLKIKITETKVIQPGETGNEYGEKPLFAIWYETTNLSDKDIDPISAWMAVFEAVQDNNPNAVNTLEVGGLPDNQFQDSQLETIKKDGTVPNAVAYELDDLETPVTLIATQGIDGDKLGEKSFDIK